MHLQDTARYLGTFATSLSETQRVSTISKHQTSVSLVIWLFGSSSYYTRFAPSKLKLGCYGATLS